MTGCDPPKKRKKKKKPALTVTVKTTQPRSHAPSKEYRDEKREERNRQRRADRATQRREKDIQAQADRDKAQFEQWAERQTNPPSTPEPSTPSVPLGWNGKPLRTCESFCGCEKCWEQCPHWCAGRCRTVVNGEPTCNCPEI